jgi:hypothetical protein
MSGLERRESFAPGSPCGLREMIRISLPYIWSLAQELEPLANLPEKDVPAIDVLIPLFTANNALQTLSGSLFGPYLRTSFALAQQLSTLLISVTANTDYSRNVSQFELWQIRQTFGQYKTALLAELGTFNSYFVTAKGPYDMFSLLAFGENLFPADLASKVPEAIIDIKEAAKALCFEVPTACGFHTFRATESVLRRYYSLETGGAAAPRIRNIGVYLHALKQAKKGDPKILASLKQMADLHRNPVIHPEVVLTTEEAIAILGIARSVVTAMLAKLPVIPPTTSTP